MKPTDELCKRLDELCVKYDATSYDNVVFWGDAEYELYGDGHTRLIVDGATPVQAINATVGYCDRERCVTHGPDETDTWECVCDDGKRLTVHVMECSECGHTYTETDVFSGYDYCPWCRTRIEKSDRGRYE